MKRVISAVLVVGILMSFACQAPVDVEKEKGDLLQTDFDFAKASMENGAAEAFNMYLDDNAMQMSGGSYPLMGRAKIYESMKGYKGDYDLLWEPQDGNVSKSADMGWTWGLSTFVVKNEDGTKKEYYGKYLNVWKKQADGSWKVLVDIGNENPAPEEEKAE